MSARIPVKTALIYTHIVSFLIKQGALKSIKRGSSSVELLNFSQKDEVQALTRKYLMDLNQLWESRHKNAVLKGGANENSDNQVKSASAMTISESVNTKPGTVPQGASPSITPDPKISFGLPNAKVSEPYAAYLQVHGETEFKKVLIKEIRFPEGLGLSASPDFRKVEGIPLKDGDHKLIIRYQFQDSLVDRPLLDAEVALFINPDPKSLWKILDSDKNDPYFKPDEAAKIMVGGDGRSLLAASQRGRSHAHVGGFRDDDFYMAYASGWDIFAVADGAGSAKSSRKGSEIAVQKATEYLINSLSNMQGEKIERAAEQWYANQNSSHHPVKAEIYEAFGRAAYTAMKAIEEEAASQGKSPKEYSTTLILAAHKKIACGHLFAAYWVGDGGVGVYQQGKSVTLLGEVDSGEFAGQTRFLDKQVMTAGEVMKRLRFTIMDEFTSLVLMTDGVTDPKFETDNNLASVQKWDELWAELEPMLACKDSVADNMLKWLEFWSPGNHDDRTIALLY